MFICSPKELALLIANRRKNLKLSQAAVGKLVGLKQQTISEFEKRPEGTKLETLFRILSAVKLDATVLTKEEQNPRTSQWNEEW
ncbi:MAG: helix-turn-helix domain-containing protein [Legionellaceae bacterium]|nr:helix-turn-helix domain-containing protein [Legionellaceae bacterium]